MSQEPLTAFPEIISSTMYSGLVSCPEAFRRRFIQGYTHPDTSIHLHFGGAFAKGLETFRRSYYSENSPTRGVIAGSLANGLEAISRYWGDFEPPTKSLKTLDRCWGALEFYVSENNPALDQIQPVMHEGEPSVEFSFTVPLNVRHPVTNNPIIYSGRFDMLATLGGTGCVGVDEKTTQRLGPSWGANWKLRPQFTSYVWGARQYGFRVNMMIVRGVCIRARGFDCKTVIEYRSDAMIDRWKTQLEKDLTRAIERWKSGELDYHMGESCAAYGGCTYLDACSKDNPDDYLGEFIIKPYDPLAVDGETT